MNVPPPLLDQPVHRLDPPDVATDRWGHAYVLGPSPHYPRPAPPSPSASPESRSQDSAVGEGNARSGAKEELLAEGEARSGAQSSTLIAAEIAHIREHLGPGPDIAWHPMERKSKPAPDPNQSLPGDRLTTPSRAALCDAIEPLVRALHDGAWSACDRKPDRHASPETLAMARELCAEARRLCAGELGSDRLDGLKFRAPLHLFDLALRASVILEAVQAFRGRYYGWHPLVRAPAWHLMGDRAVEQSRRLQPRSLEPASAGEADPRHMEELRARLAKAIEARAEELAKSGPPHILPSHLAPRRP